MYDLRHQDGEYSIWQCVMGDWYVFRGDRMLNATLYKGVDTETQARELLAYERKKDESVPQDGE